MLVTICYDTWNVLNMQHITPIVKRWDYSGIPSGGAETSKGAAHMAEGDHHLRKSPNPHPRPHPPPTGNRSRWSRHPIESKQLLSVFSIPFVPPFPSSSSQHQTHTSIKEIGLAAYSPTSHCWLSRQLRTADKYHTKHQKEHNLPDKTLWTIFIFHRLNSLHQHPIHEDIQHLSTPLFMLCINQ